MMDGMDTRTVSATVTWNDGVAPAVTASGTATFMVDSQTQPGTSAYDWYDEETDFLTELPAMEQTFAPDFFFLDDRRYHLIGTNLDMGRNLSAMSGLLTFG